LRTRARDAYLTNWNFNARVRRSQQIHASQISAADSCTAPPGVFGIKNVSLHHTAIPEGRDSTDFPSQVV
jgi:hypothetical protein